MVRARSGGGEAVAPSRHIHKNSHAMDANRTSAAITITSTLVLAIGGIALLFAPDVLLAPLAPGAVAALTVLGQLVAGGWLAMAWLNWNQRHLVIGGIYARPLVLGNFTLYLISASSLAHRVKAGDAPPAMLALAVLFGTLTLVYAALLLRGPFGRDR
ncbi:hypothetical protein [Dyella sp.]|uniref:hypothetical protein n=1 Tax=Dyella sp. TaxID=1869338 RepID=UPI002D765357|nr:hypothetical protein [Dyella sp.]HET6432699.1 hypothetical protein [Dyella sp.]